MFSSKKDNSALESRISALEQQNVALQQQHVALQQQHVALQQQTVSLQQQNAVLVQEMRNICANYNHHIERLERRITDYTDVWHPMMTANINRIKAEIVKDTKAHINDIAQQIKAEPHVNAISPIQQTDPLSGYVVVGFQYSYENQKRTVKPVFANRCPNKHDFGLTCVIRGITAFIVDSILSFPQIKYFDLVDFRVNPDSIDTPEMIDINGNVVCAKINGKLKYSQVEKLDQVLAKYGVELRYDGNPIRVATA
jgi:hypothetical protein